VTVGEAVQAMPSSLRPLRLRTSAGLTVDGLGQCRAARMFLWGGFVAVVAGAPFPESGEVTVIDDDGHVFGRGVVTGRRCYGSNVAALRVRGITPFAGR
jgi:hypothetical protein